MKPEDIVKAWSGNDLRRCSAQYLRDVAIPEPCKSFLIEVGLPACNDIGFQFDPLVGGPLSRVAGRPHLRGIGLMNEFRLVCLDELADGRVIGVDPALQDLDRYLNSSVDRFAAFIILYLQWLSMADRLAPGERAELDAQFERDLTDVDSTVFSDPENYWAIIVWEIKEGIV
jgi:hypothetical protein